VAAALNTSLRRLRGQSERGARIRAALRTFKSFSLKGSPDGSLSIGIEVDPAVGRGDTGSLMADLTDLAIDLGEAALELGTGVGLFIDEMQFLAPEDLAAVALASHEASQRNVPFFVIGAGLPNLAGLLAAAKSYSERLYQFVRVDRLGPPDARDALIQPAREEGVEWSPPAVDMVLTAADGYPYFIQQFGQTTWDAAASSPIQREDALEGLRLGRERLDHGFFRARWQRATKSERAYLAAMAADGDGPSSTGELALRLQKAATSLGPTRANLIAKGIVYAPEHGFIAFTVPGMAEFISREPESG